MVLIGAGPSISFWYQNIIDLANNGALLLAADSAARGLLPLLPSHAKLIVFSVEKRSHSYLRSLPHAIPIALYWQANWDNVPKKVEPFVFQFVAENQPWLQLVSPGTVMGAALAYALYRHKAAQQGEVHLFGIDFCYLDQQVYSPLVYHHLPLVNRLARYENMEYIRVLKKTSCLFEQNHWLIRTNSELLIARSNMARLINSVTTPLSIFNYSPIRLPTEKVLPVAPN